MPTDTAHSSPWEIAEVVFGLPFLVAIALQFLIPLSLHEGPLRLVLSLGGAALFIAGVAWIVLARQEFSRHGQPTDPGHATTRIITTGVFSISRNPLYLGAAACLAGIGLAANALWVLVLLIPSLVACHSVLIVPEEKYLAARFAEEYHAYCTTVRRWLGRK